MTMHFAPLAFDPGHALATEHAFTRRLLMRGYTPLYRADQENHCPGCGGKAWHVGRMSAECARCDTAIPLAHVAAQPMQPLFHVTRSRTAWTE